ncbi:hypothetical protein TPA0910_13690 [Streptomyces hygroscopicus subsp. sporocinereus]|uniref:Uncharacterized protein n=1 Tax=Streptomyces hygroscopicus TaxID=1912 RepID=A0ABQ3TUC2_STRHY|nr:hypothetical protein TPA0910_13690 [Streptomyces hygroscopicus]
MMPRARTPVSLHLTVAVFAQVKLRSGFLARGRLPKVISPGTPCGVVSAVDFQVRQNMQCTQQVGGAGGIGTELGQDPPVLEVGEAVLDRCTPEGEDTVGFLLPRG